MGNALTHTVHTRYAVLTSDRQHDMRQQPVATALVYPDNEGVLLKREHKSIRRPWETSHASTARAGVARITRAIPQSESD